MANWNLERIRLVVSRARLVVNDLRTVTPSESRIYRTAGTLFAF